MLNYTYDEWNRLTGFSKNGTAVASYTYNANNERTSKTVDGVTTKYYWDDSGCVLNEGSGTGITASNFIGADGIFRRQAGSSTYQLMKNGHGDVTRLLAGSTVSQSYDYDAYGLQKEEDATDSNPLRYCGEYTDEETGFIYLRNRYYDPSTERFISEDPAQDGTNWYAYCGGNPLRYVDPLGLFRIVDGEAYDKYEKGSGNIDNIVDDYISKDIEKMQRRLQELGYLDRNITWYGYFGEETLSAVNAFKADNNIQNNTKDTNGIVGATTWAYLGLDFDVLESVHYTLTNLTIEPGALHINAEGGNINKATVLSIYSIAENSKAAYKLAYGTEFNVSTDSLYFEILGHLIPNAIAKKYKNNAAWQSIQAHTKVIDSGDNIIRSDPDRWLWDWIARASQ